MNINPEEYYEAHPEQLKFIYDFMHIDRPDAFRGRVIEFLRDRDGNVHETRTAPLYYDRRPWSKSYVYALYEFENINDISRAANIAKTLYHLHHIYSYDAKRCDSKIDLRSGKYVVGWTPVFDVDSLANVEGKGRRVAKDDPETLEVFEFIRCAAMDELKSWGLWDNARMMWSGNGFYVILEDFYGDIHDIMDYGDAFIIMQKDLNVLTMREYGVEQIDWKRSISERYGMVAWNRYTKIPYTFHERVDDMSYPLNKDHNMMESLVCDETDWR